MCINFYFFSERDIRLATLEEDLVKLRAGAEDLQHSLNHKEEAVSQLKSQLEHQCLGEADLLCYLYCCRV